MKLLKILPLTLMAGTSAIIIPSITSCNKEEKIEEFTKHYDHEYHHDSFVKMQPKEDVPTPISDIISVYLEDIKANKEIYANDLAASTFTLLTKYPGEYKSMTLKYNIYDVNPNKSTISFKCLVDTTCFIYNPETSEYTDQTYDIKFYVESKNMELKGVANPLGKANVVPLLNYYWEHQDQTHTQDWIVKEWQKNKEWSIRIIAQSEGGTERSQYDYSTMCSFLAFRVVSAYKTVAYITDSNYLSRQI